MVAENNNIHFAQLRTHPQWAATEYILKKLQQNGFESLIAGGAVRDLLMGRVPGDIDIATSAMPEQVESIFPQTVAVGKAFGVIRVIHQGHSMEVATYRKDLEYHDGRRPEGVVFTDRIEDAKRRDFTINALFYDPFTETLNDDVNGKKDIEAKLLRTVGLANERFQEDELRRLRLVRFVSQLNFQVEPETRKALDVGIDGLQKVSKERITDEVGKMWQGAYLQNAFSLWLESGMAEQVDPAWQKKAANPSKEIWSLPREEKNHAWAHYFSFFFEENNLKSRLKQLKLPKNAEKFIENVHQVYQHIPNFLKAQTGEQKFQAAQEGFLLGFQYYLILKATDSEKPALQATLKKFQAEPPLPEPLIKAAQIMHLYQGPQLGNALKKLYIEQLQQNWTSSEQALQWLAKNPLNESK